MQFPTFEIAFSQKDKANFSGRREQHSNLQLKKNRALTSNLVHMTSNIIPEISYAALISYL